MNYLYLFKTMPLYMLLASLLLLSNGCNKNEPTAAPITAENTFSCKINGQLFVPEDHGGFPVIQKGILIEISGENNWTFIFGNGPVDVYIYLTGVTSTGNYQLALSNGDVFFTQETENLMEVDLGGVTGATHISTPQSGTIEVLELDLDKRIILQFNEITLVAKDNPSETIVLTEGKLNINLATLFEEN